MAIAPTFTPGSGWLRDNNRWSPGTTSWFKQRLAASWPCTVFRMREFGMRLPPASVKAPTVGALLAWQPRGTESEGTIWDAHLLAPPEMERDLLEKLNNVQLIRENEGVRLYQGEEWNPEVKRHYVQTWLCTPTVEEGLAILAKMAQT